MPQYNYRCSKCGYTFTDLRKMNDPCPPCPNPDTAAPCEGEVEKTVARSSSFHLKGGGWYKDGY